MREFLKNTYRKSRLARAILCVPKYIYYLYRYNCISDETYIKNAYKRVFGYKPDLSNPQSFTEKIQWLKLNERLPLMTKCSDKFAVKEYVSGKVGTDCLIPLVLSTKNVKDICEANLPDYPVVVKTTHDSGGVIVIDDKSKANFKHIQKTLSKKLHTNYYKMGREWEYKDIEPRIIAEKLLRDDSGNELLNDYKIYCLNGEPRYIQTIFDRKERGGGVKENWFDVEWNPIDVYYFSSIRKDNVPKPQLLAEMLNMAKTLSAEFTYVRVDLYVANNQIYFGELTFRPFSGFMKFEPKEFDRILGDQLKLPV